MRRPLAVLATAAFALGACGDGIDEGVNQGRGNRGTIDGVELGAPDTIAVDSTPDDTLPPSGGIEWISVDDGIEEGSLEVPLDHSRPNGDTITLHLVRHLAVDPANRIGALLVNPGGPGFGGSGLAWNADDIYGQDLLDRFDIIGWDPRGTGESTPSVDCIDDYDDYFGLDSSPDTPAERQALVAAGTRFGESCRRRSAELLPFISTEDSARDVDAIRKAIGDEQISYFGFSYGSELGATWATLFPDTVRAIVIDGAVDPTVGYLQQNIQQAAGFEAAFTTFLAECSRERSCSFSNDGNAEAAFDELFAAVDAAAVEVEPDRTPVTQGVLQTAVAQAMYDQSYWPQLEQALADLQDGDGQGILDLYDAYYGYDFGEWDDSLEAYFAIGCLDDPGSSGPDDLYSHEAQFAAAAPRLGRGWMAELTFCAVWPVDPVRPVTITAAGAGPVLVVGTTGDPATPLSSTRSMVSALDDGHLVVVTADQHTGYGVNRCVDEAVDAYLVDPTAPLAAELVCD